MRASAFGLAGVLAACGARSGIEVVPREERATPDAAAVDAGRAVDAFVLRPDAPIVPRDAPVAPPCDGPAHWVEWPAPTTEDLSDVIVAGDEAWIVGAGGTVLRWDGAEWRPAGAPIGEDLSAIWVDGRGAGWITSLTGLYRREAGSWRSQPRPVLPGIAILTAVWGRAPDDVWFGGGSVTPRVGIHARWDGVAVSLVDGEPTGLQVTTMSGAEDGRAIWAVSALGRIARTIDGAPWELLPAPPDGASGGVWAPSADEAWLPGLRAQVHHWLDGAWETFVVPGADAYYYAVWGSSSRDVWVAGYEGAAAHFDGTSWSAVVLPTDAIITAIDGRCATDAWMVGEGGTILRLVPDT